MNLKTQYFELLNQLNFPEQNVPELWEKLHKAYSSRNRYYNNWIHIEDMMITFFKYRNNIRQPLELQLAIFYHDIVYNVSRKDNEEESAKLAVEIFKNYIDKETLENLIIATKNHHAKTEDEKWLLDFDLAILSRNWEEYQTYFKNIRKEYRIYPDILYKPGRKKVLKHFLEKERIFLTDHFHTKYKDSARKNLEKEIKLL